MEKKRLNKLAEALGAEIITDPEERKKFERKYGLPHLQVVTKREFGCNQFQEDGKNLTG